MNKIQWLLTYRGRLNRSSFLLYYFGSQLVAAVFVFIFLLFLKSYNGNTILFLFFCFLVFTIYVVSCPVAKRFHDIGMSNWNMLWWYPVGIFGVIQMIGAFTNLMGTSFIDENSVGYNIFLLLIAPITIVLSIILIFRRGTTEVNMDSRIHNIDQKNIQKSAVESENLYDISEESDVLATTPDIKNRKHQADQKNVNYTAERISFLGTNDEQLERNTTNQEKQIEKKADAQKLIFITSLIILSPITVLSIFSIISSYQSSDQAIKNLSVQPQGIDNISIPDTTLEIINTDIGYSRANCQYGFAGEYALARFSDDPDKNGPASKDTIYLVNPKSKTLTPFSSEQAFNDLFTETLEETEQKGTITVVPIECLHNQTSTISDYKLLPFNQSIQPKSTIAPIINTTTEPNSTDIKEESGFYGMLLSNDGEVLAIKELDSSGSWGEVFDVHVSDKTEYTYQRSRDEKNTSAPPFAPEKGTLDNLKIGMYVFVATSDDTSKTETLNAAHIQYSEKSPFAE